MDEKIEFAHRLNKVRFQARVFPWMLACFGEKVTFDVPKRNYRFLEESLELVQSLGCTKEDAIELVEYVFNRPAGDPQQEVGGVMTTLAALCIASSIEMNDAAEFELARVWTKLEQIRAKHLSAPLNSPLPGTSQ